MSDDALDDFLLREAESGAPARLRGDCWIAGRVWLSDICIAAEITPLPGSDPASPIAKTDLYALLREIGHQAMDLDLMRPVAGFLRGIPAPLRKTLSRWSADQDWHRGAFTLYLEDDGQGCQVEPWDLLVSDPPILPADLQRRRSARAVLASIRPTTGDEALTATLLDTLTAALPEDPEKEAELGRETLVKVFEDWMERPVVEEGAT